MTQRHPVQNEVLMLVTTNTFYGKKFFENAAYATEAIEHLYRVQQLYPFFIHGFVIMPDHCHFLFTVPAGGSISKIMRAYKMGLAFQLGISKLWQPRFHIREIRNSTEALKYILLNPVRKNLSEMPEEYPWSSAANHWDLEPLEIPWE
ncbi:hypothetical protein A3D88_02960 [Candidatus Peribacteria bacterium RIFCSPHIGHO2_02_FULL_52_16]|nr:MAG: hypothetical protein A2706_06025 [Candidatus Peribacteria bacterium RIFCSPHIGHO2_01_FULL_51_35]OGJ60640.1 MAG: hypothetical protein A3D88_02960 [Candidatus Peribacteria bacterium RIFCSPHIGHO2_02_FULL_52_16]